MIEFIGVRDGDEDWSITTSGAVSSIDLGFTNLRTNLGNNNARNNGPLNISANYIPEPAAVAVWTILGLIGVVATRHRRRTA